MIKTISNCHQVQGICGRDEIDMDKCPRKMEGK